MFQNRVVYIEELNKFISATKNKFNKVLHAINWTEDSLLSKGLGSGSSSQTEKSGLIGQNEFLLEEICDNGQVNILDMLYGNHLQIGSGQLYSEIVASLQAVERPTNNDKRGVKTEDKAAAMAQLLKLERDAKRRRISYKNKVHTKNKSHTEVLREVLGEQMLTLTGEMANNSTSANTSAHQSRPNQAPELVAIRPPQGNPHLAWLTIVEDEEKSKTHHQIRSNIQKLEHTRHRRESSDHKLRLKSEEDEDRKNSRKNSFWQGRKKEIDYRLVDKEKRKRNGWDDWEGGSSPRSEERHHKKMKKKRSHSPSSRDVSQSRRHKTKHKKKKH